MKSIKYFLVIIVTIVVTAVTSLNGHAQKRIAITIDDLPFTTKVNLSVAAKAKMSTKLLKHLTNHNVQAVGFVNEDKVLVKGEVDAHINILEQWLDSGMELGNHNFGHLGLWKHSLEDYKNAVIQGETITKWLLASRNEQLRYYRHPYTQTGKNEAEKQQFEAFLAARNYQVAPFTIEHDDYLYSCVYDHYLKNDDTAALNKIKREYLGHLDVAVQTLEVMSYELFKRDIAQIFLIHANALNADTLGETLESLANKGYQFITLEEALTDPAYQLEDKASKRFGPSWLMRWAKAKQQKLSVYGQPEPRGWTAQQYQKICK